MKNSELELTYEAARTWAFHLISHPPSGWAQLMRGGMAGWVRERQASMVFASPSPQSAHLSGSPLLTLVAAMLAEVCQ